MFPTPRRTPRANDRRPAGPIRPSMSVWYVLGTLLVIALLQAYYFAPGGRTIPYSEFKTLVKNDQVVEVTIADQAIHGSLKTGDAKQSPQFTTTRVEDP